MGILQCKAVWQSLTGISLMYGVAKVGKSQQTVKLPVILIHELSMHIKRIPALNDLAYLLTIQLTMYGSSLS
jgi:hypothetical protein